MPTEWLRNNVVRFRELNERINARTHARTHAFISHFETIGNTSR
jgi:hypothetical protein